MKKQQILYKLSRVPGSSSSLKLSLLRQPRHSTLAAKLHRLARIIGSHVHHGVPQGHVPVYVGDKKKRFIVKTEFLNHRLFKELLEESAQEYGYEQQGVLRIACHVDEFERILEAVLCDFAYDLVDLFDDYSSSKVELFMDSP